MAQQQPGPSAQAGRGTGVAGRWQPRREPFPIPTSPALQVGPWPPPTTPSPPGTPQPLTSRRLPLLWPRGAPWPCTSSPQGPHCVMCVLRQVGPEAPGSSNGARGGPKAGHGAAPREVPGPSSGGPCATPRTGRRGRQCHRQGTRWAQGAASGLPPTSTPAPPAVPAPPAAEVTPGHSGTCGRGGTGPLTA